MRTAVPACARGSLMLRRLRRGGLVVIVIETQRGDHPRLLCFELAKLAGELNGAYRERAAAVHFLAELAAQSLDPVRGGLNCGQLHCEGRRAPLKAAVRGGGVKGAPQALTGCDSGSNGNPLESSAGLVTCEFAVVS